MLLISPDSPCITFSMFPDTRGGQKRGQDWALLMEMEKEWDKGAKPDLQKWLFAPIAAASEEV